MNNGKQMIFFKTISHWKPTPWYLKNMKKNAFQKNISNIIFCASITVVTEHYL